MRLFILRPHDHYTLHAHPVLHDHYLRFVLPEISSWLGEHSVQYCLSLCGAVFTIQIEDDNKAMLFKLRWM